MLTLRQAIEARLGTDAQHQIRLLQRRLHYAATAPATAIIGGSYTGEFSDSPAKSAPLALEISRFRKEVLRPAGIASRGVWGETSNVFCAKRWLCVSKEDFPRAAALAVAWLNEHNNELRYLHSADIENTTN